MSAVDEMKAVLRDRLDAAGVRELVQLDERDESERLSLYGHCPLCRAERTSRFTIWLDENDHVHARHDGVCECGGA